MYVYEKIPKDTKEYLDLTDKLETLREELNITSESIFDTSNDDIFNTTKIEGNSLTKDEVSSILENDVTIRGKSLKDHLQIKNAKDSISWLRDFASMHKEISYIDPDIIKKVHALVTKGELIPSESGQFRTEPVSIRFTNYIPPDEFSVLECIDELCFNYNASNGYISDFDKICEFKRNFERIHPFIDGNGRTGRFLMNLMLLQHGYGYFTVPFEERDIYFNSIDNNTFHIYAATRVIDNMEQIKVKYHGEVEYDR